MWIFWENVVLYCVAFTALIWLKITRDLPCEKGVFEVNAEIEGQEL